VGDLRPGHAALLRSFKRTGKKRSNTFHLLFTNISFKKQVLKLILQNVLLTPPAPAPPLICQLLHGCWKTQPSDRLTFQQICERLNQKQKAPDSPLSINYIDIKHDQTEDDGYQRPNPRPIAFLPSPFVAQNDVYLQPLPDIPVTIHQYTNSPPIAMLSD